MTTVSVRAFGREITCGCKVFSDPSHDIFYTKKMMRFFDIDKFFDIFDTEKSYDIIYTEKMYAIFYTKNV